MFTKRHYQEIAKVIYEANKAGDLKYAGSVVNRFCDCFKAHSPRFDRQKFLDACDIYRT